MTYCQLSICTNNRATLGKFKADLCRAAYLFAHGGYYFDVGRQNTHMIFLTWLVSSLLTLYRVFFAFVIVWGIEDILVVRPFLASSKTKFATVKGLGWPREGFFQAFVAAEAGNEIVGKSLQTMLGQLNGTRQKRHLLGPVALEEAWMEAEGVSLWQVEHGPGHGDNNGNRNEANRLLAELPISALHNENLPNQTLPTGYGDTKSRCLHGDFCNNVVVDDSDTLYFYSRTCLPAC